MTENQKAQLTDVNKEWPKKRPPEVRPRIDAGQDLQKMTELAKDALVKGNEQPTTVFRHGGLLVRIGRDDHEWPVIQRYQQAGLKLRLADVAAWYRGGGRRGEHEAEPNASVVAALLELADTLTDLPLVEQVVTTPVFAPSGVLVTDPGYSEAARLWYEPMDGLELPPVAERPNKEEVERAKHFFFTELVGDFPFETSADRAHALALFLLPFIRPMIDGPTPLHAVDAPTPGTGKGVLTKALLLAALGEVPPATPEVDDNTEMIKQLGTAFLAGYPRGVVRQRPGAGGLVGAVAGAHGVRLAEAAARREQGHHHAGALRLGAERQQRRVLARAGPPGGPHPHRRHRADEGRERRRTSLAADGLPTRGPARVDATAPGRAGLGGSDDGPVVAGGRSSEVVEAGAGLLPPRGRKRSAASWST